MPKTKKNTEKENQTLNIVIPVEMYERVRKCSFESRKSISQICREGLEKILKDYEKSY